jgi:tetratricopeptide (TPR) repeat protein
MTSLMLPSTLTPLLLLVLTLVALPVQTAPQWTPPQQTSPALATDVQWQADLSLAETLMQGGRFDEAEKHLRAMMDRATLQSLQAMAALGQLRLALGDAEGSLPFLLNAMNAFDALGETTTRRTAHIVSNIGVAFQQIDRLDEAEAASRRALAIFVEVHGEEHREVAIALNNLAGIVHARGRRKDELILRIRESAIWTAVAPPEDPMRLQSLSALAWNLTASGRALEARPLYDEVIPLLTTALGKEHITVAETHVNRGWCLQELGEFDAARVDYAAGLAIFEGALGPDHPALIEALRFQATLLLAMELPGEAAVSFARAARLVEARGTEPPEELVWLIGGQVTALKLAGRSEEAAAIEVRLDLLIAEAEKRASEAGSEEPTDP